MRHKLFIHLNKLAGEMRRRRFLSVGGVIAGTSVLTALRTVTGADGTDASGETKSFASSEQQDLGDDSSSETELANIEKTAIESPDDLSRSEIELLLTKHQDHAACPVCQGLQSSGLRSRDVGSP